jgi:hypothetical protein
MPARTLLKVFLLLLLLLGLQHEAQVHRLAHDASGLLAEAEHGVVAKCAAERCLACELLAGGCDAPVPALAAVALHMPATAEPVAFRSAHRASPFVPYRTRAPPVLFS